MSARIRQREPFTYTRPTDWTARCTILYGQCHGLALARCRWTCKEEERVCVERIEGPENMRLVRHLLLASTDRSEDEIHKQTPELGACLCAAANARYEEVVELGIKCSVVRGASVSVLFLELSRKWLTRQM